jgi:hypothetical protein
MVVHPGPEKRQLAAGVDVPGRQLFEVARQLLLGERRLEAELTTEAHSRRDVAEEVVDRRHPDRREHLLAVLLRQ